MTTEELRDGLIGIFAYDSGCVDSGIYDEALRERLIQELQGMDEETFRLTMSRIVREEFFSEEALANGYGIEDAKHFLEWLGWKMKCDV